jgi:hypothetical protein
LSILIYSGENDPSREQLQGIVEKRFSGHTVEAVSGVGELRDRFRRPVYDVDVAVLLASSRNELNRLITVENDLFLLPLIVIVPDADQDTFSKAHKLRPRYVTTAGSGGGFLDVVLVLERMLDRSQRWRKGTAWGLKTEF